MLQVDVISSLSDNYIYVINNGTRVIVVDPGSYQILPLYLKDKEIKEVAVLLTHAHPDHVDGLEPLLKDYPDAVVYGQAEVLSSIKVGRPGLEGMNQVVVAPDSEFKLQDLDFFALSTPGHAKHHYVYIVNNCMFVGDLLFSVGCGRVYDENDYVEMYMSIDKVKSYAIAVGKDTKELLMFPGHEYTMDNIKFARALPDLTLQPRLDQLEQRVRDRFSKGIGNTPVNFYEELAYNPFLRLTSPEEFARIRVAKDTFKELLQVYQQQKDLEKKILAAKAASQQAVKA